MNVDISALIGIFLGGCAIILFFWDKVTKKEREIEIIKNEMDRIFKTTNELLATEKDIFNKTKDLSYSHHLRPELSILVTKQWEFVEKTFHNRFEKHSICRRIVTEYINSGTNILLDSGSTIDLVSFELLTSNKDNVNILSNNVFAAMHLIGEKKILFRLLPGLFNDRFAATYSKEALDQIANHDFNIIILATTAIRFSDGIMVHKEDSENIDFKRSVIENFVKSRNAKLIIAADASKFIEEKDKHRGVLSEGDWAKFISDHSSRIVIVTAPLRPETDPVKRAAFEREIELFETAHVEVNRKQ